MTMQTCKFTILTSADGQERTTIKQGEIDFSGEFVLLRYQEEGVFVEVHLQKGKATIIRRGDYSLLLPLEQGKQTEGRLGIAGSDGKIALQTHSIKYVKEGKVFRLFLRYDLLFSQDEKQKMQLNIRTTLKE